MSEYAKLLKDPRWQRKRLEIFSRDNWECKKCGSTTNTLHIHHIKYTPGLPWDTPPRYLSTLCEFCHQEESIRNAFESLRDSGASFQLFTKVRIIYNTEKIDAEKVNKFRSFIKTNRRETVDMLRSNGALEIEEM